MNNFGLDIARLGFPYHHSALSDPCPRVCEAKVAKLEQLKTIGRELAMGSQGGWGQTKEFLDLVKSIGEARSKAEEDRIVLREIDTLRRRLADPDVPRRRMKEYLIRLVYVEMLGHDASFGHIHAVKMTHDESLAVKRTGYLAVTLFLSDDHDLIILIVNTIQKDLRSDNYLVVSAALVAVCKLINEETIPAVLPQVVELLGHPKEAVRKKAVMALHRFYQRSPASVAHLVSNFKKKLCDPDPGVMGATLCPLFDLISADTNSYKDLIVSLISILKQVAERRLPKTYDYHQMPAPFIQIKLLKILALLGSGDKEASGHMYTVLGDIFRKAEHSTNIGNAILYECICCVSSIYPNPKSIEAAAAATSKFLKSESHNLKYMGIDALSRLIKINPDIAEEHQLAVIDCLEDPDDTLKRKTFELLYKMTKSTNVEVIVDRMIDYMISINDSHYKTEIASRCVELAEQYAPSNQWFIQTMNKVFEHAGDLVNIRVAHNLMRLIAEGFGGEDESADSQLRSSAVDSYLRILGEPKLPSVFLQVICWVLGEYGTADGRYSASYIIGKLCDVAEAHLSDDTVKAYAISSIMKICSFEIAAGRKLEILPECQSLIDELSASHSTDLQQRAYELQALLGLNSGAVEAVMPSDASCEDFEVDRSLSFLNSFVQQSIEKGAQPYIPENERSGIVDIGNFKGQYQQEASTHSLRFEAYELPKPSVIPPPTFEPSIPLSATTDLVPVPEPTAYTKDAHRASTKMPSSTDALSADVGVRLRLDGVQKKWGKPTYSSSPSASSSTSSASQNATNGLTHTDGGGGSVSLQTRETSHDSRRQQQAEVSAEKQRLAASLFGASSVAKAEKKPPTAAQKAPKAAAATKEKAATTTTTTVPSTPPPDLLDLGDPTSSDTPLDDPFKQLEGLLGSTAAASPGIINPPAAPASKAPDLMAIFTEAPTGVSHSSIDPGLSEIYSINKSSHIVATKKGPNSQDALQKDATARQVGVTPTGNNPNLFRDLLG
ncbi:AP-4 complex subunit epsilon [Ananas comosus]|uniref:AP-4 complex subunit epsilon n=1 Tax=Ananas comosus TaxID=4615 RepID=A0A6P5GYD4_ANACO|nr:AP-4 complex subunit epsilon [Ananas comosus]